MKTSEIVLQVKEHYKEAFEEEFEFLGEHTVQVHRKHIVKVLAGLKAHGYDTLMDLTGVDYLVPVARTKVVYLLHNTKNLERIRVVTHVSRDETLDSVTSLWEGAAWYERELYDFYGVQITGHPDMKRILMPDDWQGHPLRKDYPLTEEPVQFKHGVKPKIPSEIIPSSTTSVKL